MHYNIEIYILYKNSLGMLNSRGLLVNCAHGSWSSRSHAFASWVRPMVEIFASVWDNVLHKIPSTFSSVMFAYITNLLFCGNWGSHYLKIEGVYPFVQCWPTCCHFQRKTSSWCFNICKPSYIPNMVKWWKTLALNNNATGLSPW